MTLDLRCYVITDDTSRRALNAAVAAAGAGAGVVQVRAKHSSTRELVEFAGTVADAVHRANPGTRVLVDDRADVAFALRRSAKQVHGVHLGPDDLCPWDARALLGQDAIIGVTTSTLDMVHRANDMADVVDYAGAGPYRPTPTKDTGRPPLEVDGYRPLVLASHLPVVAIGGVSPADVSDLADTGIAGVALVRAVMQASDPGAVVRAVLRAIDQADANTRHASYRSDPSLTVRVVGGPGSTAP